jgi:adenosine deaminase
MLATVVLWIIPFLLLLACGQDHPTVEDFVEDLPKIELHAHLHGSIRPSTLRALAQRKGLTLPPPNAVPRDVAGCFELFRAVHVAIDHRDALKRVVAEVLDDFMGDRVVYLELRTTPRELPADGTSKARYLQLVVSLLTEHNKINGHVMQARLLVSVDRGRGVADNAALEDLLRNVHDEANVIVGVDFSGNPAGSGRFEDYVPLLEQWKSAGVARSFSVHAAELKDPSETEAQCGTDVDGGCTATPRPHEFDTILAFQPQRLGHALHLLPRHVTSLLAMHQQHRQFAQRLAEEREAAQATGHVPAAGETNTWHPPPPPLVEVCPTSNRIVMNHSTYDEHPHLRTWIDAGYPIAISTDDSGIFGQSLTQEYMHVHDAFNLSMSQLIAIAAQPLDFIFCDSCKKQVANLFATSLFAARSRQPPILPSNVIALL